MNYDFKYGVGPGAPKSVDLFSGAGGLSLGFLLAGGAPLAAVDFDKDSVETFERNLKSVQAGYAVGIEDWTPSRSEKGADFVFGGPPCQGFSLARGTRFVDDPRNSLYKHFVRVVSAIKPTWVVMENVEGIVSIGGGMILNQILEDFADNGYDMEHRVINMAAYGVPQSRRRTIFVGHREGLKFTWPEPTHTKRPKGEALQLSGLVSSYLSVNDSLGDLNISEGNFFSHRANSQMRGPRSRNAHIDPAFTLRVRGDEFALSDLPAVSSFIPEWREEEPSSVSAPQNSFQDLMQLTPAWAQSPLQISKRKRVPIVGSRYLTLREQARLQSFPDWYAFVGKKTSVAKQIGNAVPPLFAAQLFKAILSH